MSEAANDLRDVVARFCAKYPGAFRDGEIPWVLFWMLYERLYVVLALDRLTQTEAVQLGMGYEGSALKIQATIQEAFGHG